MKQEKAKQLPLPIKVEGYVKVVIKGKEHTLTMDEAKNLKNLLDGMLKETVTVKYIPYYPVTWSQPVYTTQPLVYKYPNYWSGYVDMGMYGGSGGGGSDCNANGCVNGFSFTLSS